MCLFRCHDRLLHLCHRVADVHQLGAIVAGGSEGGFDGLPVFSDAAGAFLLHVLKFFHYLDVRVLLVDDLLHRLGILRVGGVQVFAYLFEGFVLRCHRCGGFRLGLQQRLQLFEVAVVVTLRLGELVLRLFKIGDHLLRLPLRLLQFFCCGCVTFQPFGIQAASDLCKLLTHFLGGLCRLVHNYLRLLCERGQIEKIIDLCIVCHIFSNLQYYFHVKTYTLAIFARKSLKKEFAVSLFAGMEVGTRAKDTGEKPASPKLRSIRSQ